jgi:hypothetical protein
MTRTIKARFSNGVFHPLEPAAADLVNEGDEVTLTIETASPTTPSGDPLRDTAGGWRGLIDAGALKEAIYHDREVVTRPPVRM